FANPFFDNLIKNQVIFMSKDKEIKKEKLRKISEINDKYTREESDRLIAFFSLLLEIDKRNNPKKYKNND
ncbi:MAG: hypothetical protein WD607_05805, partial [Candidatus Paceibacterota bacterium]